MEAFDLITKIGGGLSGVVTVILLILAYRSGLLAFLTGKDKTNSAELSPTFVAILTEWGKRFDTLDSGLATIAGNHLEHVQAGLNEMMLLQKEMLKLQQESIQVLKEMQKYGIKCSKAKDES